MNNIMSKLFISFALSGVMIINPVYSDLGNDWCDLTNSTCSDITKYEIFYGWQDLTNESITIKKELMQELHENGWIDPIDQEKIKILKDKICESYSKIPDELFTCYSDIQMFKSNISDLLDSSQKMPLLLDFNILNDLNNNIQNIEDDLEKMKDNFDENIFDNTMAFSEVKNNITRIIKKFSNIINSADFNNIRNFINEQDEKISLIKYKFAPNVNKTNSEQMCTLQRKYNDLIPTLIRKCYDENCQNISWKYRNKSVKSLGNAKLQLKKILNEEANIESNFNFGKIEKAKQKIYEIKKSMKKINEQRLEKMKFEYDALYRNVMKDIVFNYAEDFLYWKQSITNIEKTYELLKSINNQVNKLDVELSNKTNKEQSITEKNSGIFSKVRNFLKR